MALLEISEPSADPQQLLSWSFSHMANHRDINRRINETKSVVLAEYALDPIDPTNMQGWLLHHQTMHDNQNQVLGIQGSNLLGLDWNDSQGVLDWINRHYQEHQQASQQLDIG
jgi:hypothetical protein